MNNNTKRNFELNNLNDVDRDSKEDMKIKLLVQVADEHVGEKEEEERIRSLIEPTLKETNLPLGSDVMVSRVTIDDFDECSSTDYNDCSNKAVCENTKGSYNCKCMPGKTHFISQYQPSIHHLQDTWTSLPHLSLKVVFAPAPARSVSCVTGMVSVCWTAPRSPATATPGTPARTVRST